MKRPFLHKVFRIFLVCISIIFSGNAYSEEKIPNLSIGVVFEGGLNDLYTRDIEGFESEGPGYNFGGGLVIEKMFSNRFGFNTGFIYNYSTVDFTMDTIEAEWENHILSIPFRLITSFNSGIFSFNLLTGIRYSHVFNSEMTDKKDAATDDGLRHVDSNQLAINAGINLKFRVGKYHDLFIGIETNFYPTDLVRNHGSYYDESMHYYNANITAGYMIRTNIFPIEVE